MIKVAEIIFRVEPCAATGGFVARRGAPAGGGITTQSDSLAGLDAMILDAVGGYFDEEFRPKKFTCIFMQDPVLIPVWDLTE